MTKNNPNKLESQETGNLKEIIEKKYGISQNEIQKLTAGNTLENLETFKNQIQAYNNEKIKTLSEKQATLLLTTLQQIQRLETKMEKMSLINELQNTLIAYTHPQRNIEKYFPENLVNSAKNPQKLHEHILGFSLGIGHTILSLGEGIFAVGKGIIQTPYHLYLLASGKGKTESFKNI